MNNYVILAEDLTTQGYPALVVLNVGAPSNQEALEYVSEVMSYRAGNDWRLRANQLVAIEDAGIPLI